MKNPHAQAIGRLGRGCKHEITDADRERRRGQAKAATAARMRKRGFRWDVDSEKWVR